MGFNSEFKGLMITEVYQLQKLSGPKWHHFRTKVN